MFLSFIGPCSTVTRILGVVTPPLRTRFLWSRRNWREKRGANGESFCVKEVWHPFLLFGAILNEFLACKARWELCNWSCANQIENSSRNCLQVPFLHLRRRQNSTLNSPGKQVVPTTNCQLGIAACSISGNCNHTESVTTPIIKQKLITQHFV